MRISVFGLGRMGQALAARLLDGGHEVRVWNRSPGKAGELEKAGATEASGVGEAALGVDVAFTLLSNDEAVRQIALGEGGLIASLGSESVYVDCSTVSPATTADLAATFGTERFVALPVLGAPAAVRSGQAVYLAGGPAATIQRLEPVLTCLSDKVVGYPEAPLATAAKLTVNLVLLSGLVALAEAFAVGRAGGLSDDDLRTLLGESPMVAPGLRNRFDGVLTGQHESWWTTALGAKDAGLAASLARSAGVEVPLAETVHQRYEAVTALGLDDAGDDVAAVGRLYRPGR